MEKISPGLRKICAYTYHTFKKSISFPEDEFLSISNRILQRFWNESCMVLKTHLAKQTCVALKICYMIVGNTNFPKLLHLFPHKDT